MQNAILRLIDIPREGDFPDTRMSFRGFVGFVKECRLRETTHKAKYLDFLIHYFEERLQGKDEISEEELPQFHDLLAYMYSTVTTPLADEGEELWALSVPVLPVVVYGTDAFYRLLVDPETKEIRVSMME